MMKIRAISWLICWFMIWTFLPGVVFAQSPAIGGCLDGVYGRFDYRTDKDKIGIVEEHHFDAGTELLTKGLGRSVAGDLDYTLRMIPNHHRALMAMTNLADRLKTPQPPGSRYTVDCWFERAERFSPDDYMVKLIHGLHLMKTGRHQEAIRKIEFARASGVNDPNLHYNLGLAYLELRQYDKALESAHKAYALGFPLPGLKNRLQRAGKWRDQKSGSSR